MSNLVQQKSGVKSTKAATNTTEALRVSEAMDVNELPILNQ